MTTGVLETLCMRGSFHDRSRLSAAIRRSVSALPVFLQSSTESMALRSAVAFACEPVSAGPSALLCYAVCWRGSKGARPRCFRVCTRSALSFAVVGCALAVDCAVSRTTVQLQSRKARRQVLECFGGLRGTASRWGRRTHRCERDRCYFFLRNVDCGPSVSFTDRVVVVQHHVGTQNACLAGSSAKRFLSSCTQRLVLMICCGGAVRRVHFLLGVRGISFES